MVEELAFELQDVTKCCQTLKVSRSGYYAWLTRPASNRKLENEKLALELKQHWEGSRKTYGLPRLHEKLKKDGHKIGKNRVQKIMKENNIEGIGKKKFKVVTTDSNHKLPIADRLFKTEDHDKQVTKPNQFWGGDITYIATDEGWLYLSIFLDLFTRKAVGFSMSEAMTSDLVINSLNMGLERQGLATTAELTTHSDRGSQYASDAFIEKLEAHKITASMSRKGNCYDNAFVETFFRTLKVELVYRTKFKTRAEASAAIFEFIEVWYNRQRMHSSLGYQTPIEYEQQQLTAA
jgi:transposase InsO family protein